MRTQACIVRGYLLAVILCALALPACVSGGGYGTAGSYSSPLRQAVAEVPKDPATLKRLAETGEAGAQFHYGAYLLDKGTTATERKDGIVLIAQAANAGHLRSQARLGDVYAAGVHVARDLMQARFWWGMAAHVGDPRAQLSLAANYLAEPADGGDMARALFWSRLALQSRFITGSSRIEANRVSKQAGASLSVGERAFVDGRIAAWNPGRSDLRMFDGGNAKRIAKLSGELEKNSGSLQQRLAQAYPAPYARSGAKPSAPDRTDSARSPQAGPTGASARYLHLAKEARSRDQFERARDYLRQARRAAEGERNRSALAIVHLMRADIELHESNYGMALDHAGKAAGHFDALEHGDGAVASRLMAGTAHAFLGRFDESKTVLLEALTKSSDGTDAELMSVLHQELGSIYLITEDVVPAVGHLEIANRLAASSGKAGLAARIKLQLAVGYLLLGKTDQACAYWQDSDDMYEAMGRHNKLLSLSEKVSRACGNRSLMF